MRTLFFVLLATFGITISSCQTFKNSDAPEVVKQAFKAKYPKENKPDFAQDAHGYWEAHFKKNGEKYRADFNADGSWIETENSIKYKSLPKAVRYAIEKEFGNDEITEVEHVMSNAKGEFYDVEFKRKGKNYDVEYRKDGSKVN
ncbi:MAG: PepSY-like domain-containing protein [Nonlabens sp.]|nr:PepSY-like domain-containing protein [Nonlabens sp.]